MAKTKRVTQSRSSQGPIGNDTVTTADRFDPLRIAAGLLGGTIVYVSHYPSDSVAVEGGDALALGLIAIVIATIAWAFHRSTGEQAGTPWASRLLDIAPWLLAVWMMIAAWASSPPGNLRMATNEAWLWVTAAALFTATRRLSDGLRTRQAIVLLILVCAVGQAVHGLHQQFISLPANRAQYEREPERVLQLAGVDAPADSAERMVFENRLYDGGPTGSFALANSLAAVLLVGVVGGLGGLLCRWSSLNHWQRIGWSGLILLCLSCLIAARSRSAILATLAGMALMVLVSSGIRGAGARVLYRGLGAVGLLGMVGTVGLALFGNREWFAEAPASLAVRLQYWRSTWQMVLDRPLFAAGPGNFQSIYERYREASTTEQIAEPHNLFFETIASGGPLALTLLLVGGIAAAMMVWPRLTTAGEDPVEAPPRPADDNFRGPHHWFWLGAILALLMIWLLGWASRRPPDLAAHVFVLPVAIATAIGLWPSVRSLASRQIDSLLVVVLVALLIHLLASGGWTVPGVAILVWLSAGVVTRLFTAACSPRRGSHVASVVVPLVVGLLTLAALYFLSLRPVQERQRLMLVAEMAQASGNYADTRRALEAAVRADPWAPDASLWLADLYRWKMILQPSSPADRARWGELLDQVKDRAGDDPAVYRQVGAQQLHLYQKFGAAADLEAAAETFEKAVSWSPANQWMMAQLAVIAQSRGQPERAAELAATAAELSRLGGNIERDLSRQQIYPAVPLGNRADRGAVRVAAQQLLFEPNDRP